MKRWFFKEALKTILPALFVLGVSACSSLRTDVVKHPSTALPPAQDTASARYVNSELIQHGEDKSGFRLLTMSSNALMSRIALADHAQRSIDLQYYIFANDATGRLLAQRLLAAADRGVRVRMLLDDISLADETHMLDALNAHPNISVRLFNPFRTREPSVISKATQFLLEGRRLNRRMHNKSFTIDNIVTVIGGRNIGDAYFDASYDTNFRDLDAIAIGPVVEQASAAFDAYWNCDAAYPLKALGPQSGNPKEELEHLRVTLAKDARTFAQSDYAQAALDDLPNGATADRPGAWFWGPAAVFADDPGKIETDKDQPALRIGPKLKSMVDGAQHEVLLISPYFIPGTEGTKFLIGLVQRGIAVKVLTNSLASTDEPVVQSHYARYRRDLLEGGVQLYELRPAAGSTQTATMSGTSSGVGLHAKAIVVDSQQVFIGSMNMDGRSKLLNTEMGVVVDSAPLAEAVEKFFDTSTAPTNAYQVVLQGNEEHFGRKKMQWQATKDGQPVTYDHDPEVTAARRAEVFLTRLLPIEGML